MYARTTCVQPGVIVCGGVGLAVRAQDAGYGRGALLSIQGRGRIGRYGCGCRAMGGWAVGAPHACCGQCEGALRGDVVADAAGAPHILACMQGGLHALAAATAAAAALIFLASRTCCSQFPGCVQARCLLLLMLLWLRLRAQQAPTSGGCAGVAVCVGGCKWLLHTGATSSAPARLEGVISRVTRIAFGGVPG